MKVYTVERDDIGGPIAILYDGFTVIHLVPSERTGEYVDSVVCVLNAAAAISECENNDKIIDGPIPG